MVEVTFKYKDSWSGDKWNTQKCTVESVEECKKIYGLGIDADCEYKIISVKEV